MDHSRATRAFIDASAALVSPHDPLSPLIELVGDCEAIVGCDAAGILLQGRLGRLELLTASSHQATELELHQAAVEQGPCLEAMNTCAATAAATEAQVTDRWPVFGPVMIDAGFASVHAAPLRWHGGALGALGLFRCSDRAFTTEESQLAQAFADTATMMVIQSEPVEAETVPVRVRTVLKKRAVLEQAKGVLAEQLDVDMAEAYRILIDQTEHEGANLTDLALGILDSAHPQDYPGA